MKHLMIDLETLGNKPGALVVSLSAVQFDIKTGDIGERIEQFLPLEDSVTYGLDLDLSTVIWWLGQDKEAQKRLLDGIESAKCEVLYDVLLTFNNWVMSTFGNYEYEIWGNSARFDLGILSKVYEEVGLDVPWNHRNERDVRTLVSFAPQIKDSMAFEGVKHNGLDDCFHQIKYCSAIYNLLKQRDEYEEDTLG